MNEKKKLDKEFDKIKQKIKFFEEFYELLMRKAPKNYDPWFFPCKKNGKDPNPTEIINLDPSSKGSWHHTSAKLNKEQIIEQIKKGNNIGISARNNDPLIIGDIDDEKYLDQAPKDTLVNTSRKRKGKHFFGWDKNGTAKINLPTKYGEMRSQNQYVLSPGSYVPTPDNKDELSGYYNVEIKNLPKQMVFNDLPQIFKDKEKENIESEAKIKNRETKKTITKYDPNSELSQLFNLRVSDIIGTLPKNRVGHPLHSSDTDANFSMSKDGILGHCWRHIVSLNAIQYLCVMSGKYDCGDAGTPHKGRGLSKIKGDKESYKVALEEAKKLRLIKKEEIRKINPKNKKDKEDKEERIERSLYIDKDIIAEQVYNEGINKFCIYNNKTGIIIYKNNIGDIYPIVAEEVKKGAILLPSKAETYENDKELDKKIKVFINKWLDIPEQDAKFALWNIKRSWVYERFQTINYLRALGDTGLGKTRYLRTLGYIHYKPIMTSGAATTAPIFRIIEKWKGTMLIDEGDIKQSDEKDELIKIINLGFEQKQFLMRCDQNDNKKIDFFDPFCPKIIATRRSFKDKATESRCVTTVMIETTREDIPYELNEEFYKEAQQIRNQLLMWRFKNYYKINTINQQPEGFENIEPRLKQIFNSYTSLFTSDEDKKMFKEFVKTKQEDIIEERKNSFAGDVIQGINTLLKQGSFFISNQDIISEASLTNFKDQPMKPRGLTPILKSLGFKKCVNKRVDGVMKRHIPLNKVHLNNLFKRYGFETIETIETVATVIYDFNKVGDQEGISESKKVGGASVSIVSTVSSVSDKFTKLTDNNLSECHICGSVANPLKWEDQQRKMYCDNCKKAIELQE